MSVVDNSTLTASAPVPAASVPKPVTPAEDLGQPPAKALDPIVESNLLDKVQDMAKPYLDKAEPYVHKVQVATEPYVQKVQVATKPYTDKAAAKFEQIVDKIEGNDPSTTALPTSAGTLDKSIDNAKATSASAASGTAAFAGDAGEKAKGLFEQGVATVQSTFNQITNTIEQKTTTESHPGLITQVTNAVHKGIDKVEVFLNEGTDATIPATTAPLASTTPAPTASEVPVQTSTNTLPHVPVAP